MSLITFTKYSWQSDPRLQQLNQESQTTFTRIVAQDNPSSEELTQATETLQNNLHSIHEILSSLRSLNQLKLFDRACVAYEMQQTKQLIKICSMHDAAQAGDPVRAIEVEAPLTPQDSSLLDLNEELPLFFSLQELGQMTKVNKAWNRSCQSLVPYYHGQCLVGINRWGQQLELDQFLSALPIYSMAFEMRKPRTLQELERELEALSRRFLLTTIQTPETDGKRQSRVIVYTNRFSNSRDCPSILGHRLQRCVNVLFHINNQRTEHIRACFNEDVLNAVFEGQALTHEQQENILVHEYKKLTIKNHQCLFASAALNFDHPLEAFFLNLEPLYNERIQPFMHSMSPAEAFSLASTCAVETHSKMFGCITRLSNIDPEAAWDVLTNDESFLIDAPQKHTLLTWCGPAQARVIAEKIPDPTARQCALMMCANLEDGKEDA
jgi:hypothetical protein